MKKLTLIIIVSLMSIVATTSPCPWGESTHTSNGMACSHDCNCESRCCVAAACQAMGPGGCGT